MSEVMPNPDEYIDKEVKRAVFKIFAGRDSGTGFLVQDQQHVLTAKHVVENNLSEQIRVVIDVHTNEQRNARVEKSLPTWDVVLLLLDAPVVGIQPLTLTAEKLINGAKFSTYGFPEAYEYRWYPGEVTGSSDDGNYEISFNKEYIPQLSGLSGGPVFLLGGLYRVIGIMCEHGPHPAQGKIVSVDAFYNALFVEAQSFTTDPWCYVVLSETDKVKRELHQYTLRNAVERALRLLDSDPRIQKGIELPDFTYATSLVSNLDKYKEAVQKLCKAKIAIFDITHYEPAVMLLLGIRSVVRRGVTIASYGDEFIIGDPMNFPFNIADVNIISHSAKQQQKGDRAGLKDITPPYILRDKIREGLINLINLPQYLDLPTFDAIRNLPPEYRAPIIKDILVLCSYGEKYKEANWKNLWAGLKEQLDNKSEVGYNSRVIRILDLMSPRLVSLTIYETIRRIVLCIVDWTEWRPNVFFEFGVRLSVTNNTGSTICIIEDKHKQMIQEILQKFEEIQNDSIQADEIISKVEGIGSDNPLFAPIKNRYIKIAYQCKLLLELFEPLVYTYYPPDQYDEQQQYEEMMYNYGDISRTKIAAKGKMGLASIDTYETIEANIDMNEEIAVTPVYLDLLRTARLFTVEDSEGQAAVLYPNNKELTVCVDIGVAQRLLAAWYFIINEYTSEEIVNNSDLFNVCNDIGLRLPRLLKRLFKERKSAVAEEIRFTRRLLLIVQEWAAIKNKYSGEEIGKNAEVLKEFQTLDAKLSNLLKEYSLEESRLIKDIRVVSQSLHSIITQGKGDYE
jgi:Trypsin-like peptidase domain